MLIKSKPVGLFELRFLNIAVHYRRSPVLVGKAGQRAYHGVKR